MEFIAILDEYLASVEEERKTRDRSETARCNDGGSRIKKWRRWTWGWREKKQRVDAIELINTISKEQYTPVHGGKEEPPERREFIVARDKILRERPKNKLPDGKAS